MNNNCYLTDVRGFRPFDTLPGEKAVGGA